MIGMVGAIMDFYAGVAEYPVLISPERPSNLIPASFA